MDFENPAAVSEWNSSGRTISAHNSFLQISYDLGVPFAIYFWLAFLWLLAGTSAKRWAYVLPFLAAAMLETAFLVINVSPILGLYVHAMSATRWSPVDADQGARPPTPV